MCMFHASPPAKLVLYAHYMINWWLKTQYLFRSLRKEIDFQFQMRQSRQEKDNKKFKLYKQHNQKITIPTFTSAPFDFYRAFIPLLLLSHSPGQAVAIHPSKQARQCMIVLPALASSSKPVSSLKAAGWLILLLAATEQ